MNEQYKIYLCKTKFDNIHGKEENTKEISKTQSAKKKLWKLIIQSKRTNNIKHKYRNTVRISNIRKTKHIISQFLTKDEFCKFHIIRGYETGNRNNISSSWVVKFNSKTEDPKENEINKAKIQSKWQ